MRLENNYYKINGAHVEGQTAVFHIAILPGCDVYRGHFPGQPVCPGVLNVQMIKECTQQLVCQPLHISAIHRCRMLAVATPQTTPEVDVRVSILPISSDGQAQPTGYNVNATISDKTKTYVEFKGEMTA